MSEKNTSSILETIKKKLHKLDKQSESNDQPTQVDDEFQYISSGEASKKEAAPEKLPSISDSSDSSSEKLKINPVTESENLDGLNFDELDLDNEDGVSQKPLNPISQNSAFSNKMDTAVPDLDSPADWLKNESTKANSEIMNNVSDPVIPTSPFGDLNGALPNLAKEESKDDFMAGLESPAEEGISEEEMAAISNPLAATENSQPLKPTSDDLDLESLGLSEDEILKTEVKSEVKSDPISFDDLDLGIDDLGLNESPKPESLPTEAAVKDSDDLDFGDLDEELKKELEDHLEKQDEAELGEFKKDSLEEEFSLGEMDNKSVEEALTSSNKSNGENLKEFSLDDLESDDQEDSNPLEFASTSNYANSQEQVVGQNTTIEDVKVDSSVDDFDFENELMGNDMSSNQSSTAASQPELKAADPITENIQKIEVMSNNQNQSSSNMMMESVASGNRVLNDTTVKQVSDSVKKLIDAKNVVAGVSSFSQSPALAEIAAQLMEPKIDKWFNENLSELVEKIVREEIKKLIPKE